MSQRNKIPLLFKRQDKNGIILTTPYYISFPRGTKRYFTHMVTTFTSILVDTTALSTQWDNNNN